MWLMVAGIMMLCAGWFVMLVAFVYANKHHIRIEGGAVALAVCSGAIIDLSILTIVGRTADSSEWTGGLLTWSYGSPDDEMPMAVKARVFIGVTAVLSGLGLAFLLVLIYFSDVPLAVFLFFINTCAQVAAAFLFWQACEREASAAAIGLDA